MTLEILIGMIASGKTTYAKKCAREGAVIVNADAIVNAIHCDQYGLYNDNLKALYKAVETNLILTAMAMNRNVVIDRTNLDWNSRSRYIAFGRMLNYFVKGVIFPMESPMMHAQRRFETDNRGISLQRWQAVAEKHAATYVMPSLDEGFHTLVRFDFESQGLVPCV